MSTRRSSKTRNATPVASPELVEAAQTPTTTEERLTNENADSFDDALAGAFDQMNEEKTVDSELNAVADEAHAAAEIDENVESHETTPATTTKPKAKAKRRRGGADGILSQPAGPDHTPSGDDPQMSLADFKLPTSKQYVGAFAKLLALKPGIGVEEVSSILHTKELDGDGLPKRLSTTKVYCTYNFRKAGLGVERKSGGLYLLLPEGYSIDEFKKMPSEKLVERATLNGRDDIVELEMNSREA